METEIKVRATNTGMIGWKADRDKHIITIFFSEKKCEAAKCGEAEVIFEYAEEVLLQKKLMLEIQKDNITEVTVKIQTENEYTEEIWKIYSEWCANPVLSKQYADPDIELFGDTYYLYTTTDGFSGWSGTQFHVFSSKDLVNFRDEGVILDVASDDVAWSIGSAWAPCIETRNGKYYFYFCAKDTAGDSQIGVAVSDHPAGPFTAMPQPIVTKKLCAEHGVLIGQAIDPSVFTDEDGCAYLLFGNGGGAVAKLNEDMVSLDLSTLAQYNGLKDFREAVTVTKRGGIYHFTWSCDDTGSPDYHVNYGISDSIYGPVEYKYTLLKKDEENGILGTGHHCILSIPNCDEYYIAYHRFFTPLGTFAEGLGFHRETCIDKLYFDKDSGLMLPVTPTHKGICPRFFHV